jgi:hypothetical protein
MRHHVDVYRRDGAVHRLHVPDGTLELLPADGGVGEDALLRPQLTVAAAAVPLVVHAPRQFERNGVPVPVRSSHQLQHTRLSRVFRTQSDITGREHSHTAKLQRPFPS